MPSTTLKRISLVLKLGFTLAILTYLFILNYDLVIQLGSGKQRDFDRYLESILVQDRIQEQEHHVTVSLTAPALDYHVMFSFDAVSKDKIYPEIPAPEVGFQALLNSPTSEGRSWGSLMDRARGNRELSLRKKGLRLLRLLRESALFRLADSAEPLSTPRFRLEVKTPERQFIADLDQSLMTSSIKTKNFAKLLEIYSSDG